MNNMKILFISLGCDKNLVDSEHMLGLLVEHGFEITDSEEDAEVIVINTCCFIHDAKEESIQNILEMAKYRTAGSCKVLLVTGCMAERYRDEIIEEIPEVDAVLGTNSYDKILDAIQDVLCGDRFQEYADLKGLPKIDAQRVVTTGGHYEYLKIAEGCDKHCTYCIIPKLRGPYRSVPMEELIAEAKTMAEQGVKELVLVAQETTIYGIDLYGKPSLHLLLKELCKIQELYWIRILYCYPEDIYPELVQTMKEEPKVCHYLDLPIQHANDEILRRLGRRTSKQELIDKIDFLRSEMPDITLRTAASGNGPPRRNGFHETHTTYSDGSRVPFPPLSPLPDLFYYIQNNLPYFSYPLSAQSYSVMRSFQKLLQNLHDPSVSSGFETTVVFAFTHLFLIIPDNLFGNNSFHFRFRLFISTKSENHVKNGYFHHNFKVLQ